MGLPWVLPAYNYNYRFWLLVAFSITDFDYRNIYVTSGFPCRFNLEYFLVVLLLQILEEVNVCLDLGVSIWYRVGHVDLIFRIFKCIVESQCIIFLVVVRIQIIYLLAVAGRIKMAS